MIRTSNPVATTSLEGISRRATDVTTIAGVATDETVSPANITAKLDTDGALTGNLDTRIATQKATKIYADTKTAKASNLSDVANAATAFSNIKQAASTSATGVVELATDAETLTGTSQVLATTPANITAKLANPGSIGASTPASTIAVNAIKVVTGAGLNKQLRSDAVGNMSFFTPGTAGSRDLTISASDPSGGVDGDLWFKYI